MRRKHCEVTDPKEIERILSMTNVGRLALERNLLFLRQIL